MEMSIQELFPIAATAEIGKTEVGGENTPAVPVGAFAEVLEEFAAERASPTELGTGASDPSGDAEANVPLNELRLALSPEVSALANSEDEENPIAPIQSEVGRTKEHLHDASLLHAVSPEHAATAEVSRPAGIPGRVIQGSARPAEVSATSLLKHTTSGEDVGLPASGVPAAARAVERVNEMVHATDALAKNPLVGAKVVPLDTVEPKTIATTLKVDAKAEPVAQQATAETREPISKVVTDTVRSQPLISMSEDQDRVEASLRIRQDTVNPRPAPGPAQVLGDEVAHDETGRAATVLATSGTPKRTGLPVPASVSNSELEPVSDTPLKVPSPIVEALASSRVDSNEGEKMSRLATELETAQPAKATPSATGSRMDVSVEVKPTDTLAPSTSGNPANASVPVSASSASPVVEHLASQPAEHATLQAPVRTTVAELGGAAIKGVRYLVSGGQESITVRLVPESLGELHLTVKVAEGGLEIELKSASATVRAAIELQLPGLREALARGGIEVAQVTLSEPASTGSPAGTFDRGDHNNDGAPKSRPNGSSYRNAEPDTGSTRGRRATTTHAGSLDLFV